MASSGPESAATIQANASTTQVRSAVARSESVVLMPHLARMDVMPAKNAEANAAAIRDKERLRLIERRRFAWWVWRRRANMHDFVQYSARLVCHDIVAEANVMKMVHVHARLDGYIEIDPHRFLRMLRLRLRDCF